MSLQSLEQDTSAAIISSHAIAYLVAWRSEHGDQLPLGDQLSALETLTQMPGLMLWQWLLDHGTFAETVAREDAPSVELSYDCPVTSRCRVRPSDASLRHVDHVHPLNEPTVFECTNGCGAKFLKRRKGEWKRHERMNFEEWPCTLCDRVSTRRDHLKKHLASDHNDAKITDHPPRQFLLPEHRPCGFCSTKLKNWDVWLTHVAGHFLGRFPGGAKKMEDWQKRRGFRELQQMDEGPSTIEAAPLVHSNAAKYHHGQMHDGALPSADFTGAQFVQYANYSLSCFPPTEEPRDGTPLCVPIHILPISALGAKPPKGDDIEDLNASMGALTIYKLAWDHHLPHRATSSNHSCSCDECVHRLELTVPATQQIPGGLHFSRSCVHPRSLMLERYLAEAFGDVR